MIDRDILTSFPMSIGSLLVPHRSQSGGIRPAMYLPKFAIDVVMKALPSQMVSVIRLIRNLGLRPRLPS